MCQQMFQVLAVSAVAVNCIAMPMADSAVALSYVLPISLVA